MADPDTLSAEPVSVPDILALINARVDDNEFQQAQTAHLAMLQAARQYYDGNHPKPLKVRRDDRDPNIIINFCRKIIDNGVAWLFGDTERGEMLKMEIETETPQAGEPASGPRGKPGGPGEPGESGEPDKPAGVSTAEAWLTEVWLKNGGARLLQRFGRRGSITGHVFVKVIPQNEPGNDTGYPRVVLMQSDMVAVLTRQDDTEVVEAYIIEWEEKRQINGRIKDVRIRQIIARIAEGEYPWVVAFFNDTGKGKTRWVEDKPAAIWPYTWCPIVEWQNLPNDNGDYYGLSDLEDLTAINDGINFSVSNTNRILYIHGHPRTIGTGFDAGDVQDTAIDAFWTVPNPNAEIKNLEMQSDLASAFAFLQFLSQAFYNIGRDLDIASLQDKVGQITNFGLRVLASSALSKLGEKRMNYGDGINRINRILLELGDFQPQDVKLHWKNPLPEDVDAEVKRLQIERGMEIVSKQTAAEERGRNWPSEQERMEREAAGQGNVGAALLEAFERGGAIQPLRSAQPKAVPAGPAQLNMAKE